jgi:hypothetical protein
MAESDNQYTQSAKCKTQIAAASASPTWKVLYDIVGDVDNNLDKKFETFAVQGEDKANSAPVGGDEQKLTFRVKPKKTGTEREGFTLLQDAFDDVTVVFLRSFDGPIATGTRYKQHAYYVRQCKRVESRGGNLEYDIELLRTKHADCVEVDGDSYTAP